MFKNLFYLAEGFLWDHFLTLFQFNKRKCWLKDWFILTFWAFNLNQQSLQNRIVTIS